MEAHELKYKTLEVAKLIAIDNIRGKIVPLRDSIRLQEQLSDADMKDALVLLRLINKEIKENNAKILSKESKIRGLTTNTRNVFTYKLLNSVNILKVERIIKNSPGLKNTELIYLYKNS